MSRLKRIISLFKAVVKQSKTEVSDNELILSGFIQSGQRFTMGSLVIRKIGRNYFYLSKYNKPVKIKNMFIVSQLVYGRIDYGR